MINNQKYHNIEKWLAIQVSLATSSDNETCKATMMERCKTVSAWSLQYKLRYSEATDCNSLRPGAARGKLTNTYCRYLGCSHGITIVDQSHLH